MSLFSELDQVREQTRTEIMNAIDRQNQAAFVTENEATGEIDSAISRAIIRTMQIVLERT